MAVELHALLNGVYPESITMASIDPTDITVSHNKRRIIQQPDTQRFLMTWRFRSMLTRAEIDPIIAACMQLRGRALPCYARPYGRFPPKGIYDGGIDSARVYGASQTGRIIVSDGWRVSASDLLLPGDMVAFNDTSGNPAGGDYDKLHMVTNHVHSNSAGQVWINIEPAVVISPYDNGIVALNSPDMKCMLVSDTFQFDWDAANRHGLSLEFEEVTSDG